MARADTIWIGRRTVLKDIVYDVHAVGHVHVSIAVGIAADVRSKNINSQRLFIAAAHSIDNSGGEIYQPGNQWSAG